MAKFLTGKDLENAVYDLIFQAKKKLLIVSPYIKLDDYFKQKLFDRHVANSDLHLIIVFGKNESSPNKSFNKQDFEYFTKFPNISIVYVPNLHAKYYANESIGIVTSINLYDYSFKNNIEYGIISETNLIGIGNDKVDQQAWEASMGVISEGRTVFIRRPNYKKKLFGKDYLGSTTLVDNVQQLVNNAPFPKVKVFDYMEESFINVDIERERQSREEFETSQKVTEPLQQESPAPKGNESVPDQKIAVIKTISASQIAKKYGVTSQVVTALMNKEGLVNGETITDLGKAKGLELKSYMGKDYIAYPESLEVLKILKA